MDGQQQMLKLFADNWNTVHRVKCYGTITMITIRHPCKCLYLGATYYSNAHFGQGIGPIFLDNVRCSGAEAQLISCSYSTLTSSDYHFEDAGVRCTS